MRRMLMIAMVGMMGLAGCGGMHESEAGGWRPIFNGKNLKGWYTWVKGEGRNSDPQKIVQVEDGVIHMYKDAPRGADMPFGYMATLKEYGDCRVRYEYKWGTKRFGDRVNKRRDAGLIFWAFGPDGNQMGVWPYGVECQAMENDTGDIYAVGTSVTVTADLSNPKVVRFKEKADGGVDYTTRQMPHVNDRVARSRMVEVEGWNRVEVVMRGDSAVYIVNGVVNNRISAAWRPPEGGEGPWVKLTKGRLVLQAEGAEVFYRNVEVKKLE